MNDVRKEQVRVYIGTSSANGQWLLCHLLSVRAIDILVFQTLYIEALSMTGEGTLKIVSLGPSI